MKKISIKTMWALLPAMLLLMTVSSCKKDFLDRRPLGRFSDDDLAAGSYDGDVFAAYALLRADALNNHEYLGIHSFRSDEAMKGSSTSDGSDLEQMFDDFQYNKSNGGIQGYWTANYTLINSVNRTIAKIEREVETPTPASIINLAESKFLRAHAYFNLVRAFGRVPKIDFEITEASQANIAKVADVAEIYTLIDADLTEAETNLPLNWDAQFISRSTKGTAMSLHARTYMFRRNYGAALGLCQAVIASNQYSLVSNYGSQFRKSGENGPESIFEVQAYFDLSQDLGIIYTNVQGVRGAGNWDLGWGWNVPTQNLVDEFETGDPRRIETILYSGQTDPLYGETVPSEPTVPRPYWNKKVYTDPADRTMFNNRFGRWMNHRLIRYADVLLMAAEAANEVGSTQNTTDALTWLEMIRARARGGNAAILPAVTTTDQVLLREALRHERFVEFGMEELRFYDLVRWEIDVDVLHAAGKSGYQIKHRLLPIPQGEIDKSGGKLIQNDDYM